jgi:uncharacterized protein
MYDIVVGRNASDFKKYGTRGTILLGKHYVKMGQTTSLSNKVFMDVTRSHVVFVCGKRGGGKCLHEDTLITMSDGSQIKIKDLEKYDKEIITLNSDLKVNTSEKTEFYKRDVGHLLKLKLRSGKEIKLTKEHPLLTVEGWKPIIDLKKGSRIATPRKLDFFGQIDLSEEKVKILAYLISEGHISNNFILFTNKDNKIMNDFKKSIIDFDNSLILNNHSDYTLRIVQNLKRKLNVIRDNTGKFLKGSKFDSKSTLRKWLDKLNLYGKLSGEKFIPKIIFNLPKNKISLFLNRLFSCDGSIWSEKHTWKISYASKSKRLIEQIHHLLLKFDILSRYREKKFSYELELKGENVTKFIHEIGFYGYKEERQKKALLESEKIVRNPNLDTIPKEIWNSYRPENWSEIGKSLGYKYPKSLRESINYSPSRQKLQQISKMDNNEMMYKLATSDIFWDEIISIEELKGNFTVYDITVPKTHNFIANDIIVHNSYTMGVIAEGVSDLEPEIKQNISIILLDTMGIYWTMKYPNSKEKDLLDLWDIKPKALDVTIFIPHGHFEDFKKKGIPADYPFSLRPDELDIDDWALTLKIERHSDEGILIEKIVTDFKDKGKSFSIDEIIDAVKKDQTSTQKAKDATINMYENIKTWGLFAKEGTPLNDLVVGGQVTVLDVSIYATMPGGWEIKSLVVGLVSKKLFAQRMVSRREEEFQAVHETTHYFMEDVQKKMTYPMVWLVIDEAHEFMPVTGKTAASGPLVTILREGRQPGISLILATQQPGKIHTDVMTQSDTIISHRITAKIDTDALAMLMQSYMRTGLDEYLDNLPREKGAAIILDDSNERMYPMRVRPRFTWHGGEAPVAIPRKKKVFKL